MSFAPIAIKTSIPGTAPAATSGALTFSTIEDENWLQILGDATAGSGSLYLLRWNATLSVWHPYMGDKPIAVDSTAFSGLFSAYYPFPKGDESFVLYDPTGTITATASAARTGSPLVAPAPASSGAAGGATAAKQDTGNASLAMIATQQTDGTQKTQVTSCALPTGAATAAKQPALGTAGTPSVDVLSVQGVVGGTPQPISASSLPLPSGAATSALQGGGLPAALVGGRLDVNTGAWLGSTSPTVGQKAMSASLPVVVASDQSTLPVVQPSATYSVISTSTTTTVASSACTLYKIFWAAGVSSTMAAYDNGSGGTTNQFVSKLTSSDGEIDFGPIGVRLANGLTVVTTGGTPAFVTIVLRT